MPSKLFSALLILACAAARAQSDSGASAVSERDFLGDVPVVLSVSRLAQPVDEAPGAVTVLDRQFIRNSGARDVVDLLRFVPGFQTTTSFETDAPMATYHGRIDDFANRIQVMVDGRSVYFGHMEGSTGLGLQVLAIEDIDRIEVLRGSNSATYGARAFLGVINIISKPLRERVGSSVQMSVGENGIQDAGGYLGWGDQEALFSLSLDRRADDGLRGAYGKNQIERVNAAALLFPAAGQELEIRLGNVGVHAGRGSFDPTEYGNIKRTRFMGSQHAQLNWRNAVSDSQDIEVHLSRTTFDLQDSFPFLDPGSAYYGWSFVAGGTETNDALLVETTNRHSNSLRSVMGAEFRHESVSSAVNFGNDTTVSSQFGRVFGTLEWRVAPDWVLNFGALAEKSSLGGDSVSPRVMANWQAWPGHTLRAGVSTAFRPPSAYEKYAARHYWNPAHTLSTPYFTLNPGTLGAEKLQTEELGYNFTLRSLPLTGDVRVFAEHITDGIRHNEGSPQVYLGKERVDIVGMEYQLDLKLGSSTRVFTGGGWTTIDVRDTALLNRAYRTTYSAPKFAGSLMVMHEFSNRLAVTVMHQRTEQVTLMSAQTGDPAYSMGRTDVRVSKVFHVGRRKGEIAFTVQNLDQPYRDGDRKFFFDRRAFVSVRVDH